MEMKRFSLLVLIAFLFIFAHTSFASEISLVGDQEGRFLSDHVNNEDFLYINPPNSAGISVNIYSSFNVDEPLKIMNTPRYHSETGEPIRSAEVIYLITQGNGAQLSSFVDIVGPATDVLILNNGGSSTNPIRCVACNFSNVLRLSLVSSEQRTYGVNTDDLGVLKTGGSIEVSSLYAPGATGLEFVASNIEVTGNVDVNQRVIKNGSTGGYTALAHGNLKLGTGGIDVIVGNFYWHYEKNQITQVESSGLREIDGNFYAPRVHISAASYLNFYGNIDTRTEVVGAVSYKGQTHIPKESAVVQTLANDGELRMRGAVQSEGSVSLRSGEDIYLFETANVEGEGIELVARRDLYNYTTLSGNYISSAAFEVTNEGVIDGKEEVKIWAASWLVNQYGGVIRGKKIDLTSKASLVRNGSRTPYKDNLFSSSSSDFLDFGLSSFLGGSTLQSYQYLNSDYDYASLGLDATELGTFYMVPYDIKVTGTRNDQEADKYTAHIVGDEIRIHARAFENINPYYVRVDEQDSVVLERQRISQVSVSAESLFELAGASADYSGNVYPALYFINSSARLSVNSSEGSLILDARRVINNRYRVATYLVPTASEGDENEGLDGLVSTEANGFQSLTAVYSPPGFLMSMGSVKIKADNFFANVLGYVEFFKGFELLSPQLKNFGMENQAYDEIQSIYSHSALEYYAGYSTPFNFSRLLANKTIKTTENEQVLRDPNELDMLFHVSGGALNASSAEGWFEIFNPFLYFSKMAIDDAVEQDYDDTYRYRVCRGSNSYSYLRSEWADRGNDCPSSLSDLSNIWLAREHTDEYTYRYIEGNVTSYETEIVGLNNFEGVIGDGVVTVEVEQTDERTIYKDFEVYVTPYGYSAEFERVEEEEKQYSLLEELENLYDKIKSKFADMLNEISWWD